MAWERQIADYWRYQGKLADGAAMLAECLQFDEEFDRAGERLGTYAFLKTAEDTAESKYQRMQGRYLHAASQAAEAASYIRPEILAIPAAKMKQFLADACLDRYRLLLERLLRFKPHTLGKKEEHLLAMQTEMSQAAAQIFRQLTDADLKFGPIRNDKGRLIELSHATFSTLLHSPQRSVRKAAFHQYYRVFAGHQHALAASLAASVQRDIYYARARNYPSALEAALFPDRMPVAVYDNLIESVRRHLPAVHRYYDLRRRKMRLRDIHHYDTYVPILAELQTRQQLEPGRRTVHCRTGTPGQRVLRRAGKRARGPLVRPLRKPRQAERRVQQRLLRRRSLHPHELSARRAGPRFHAGPRGRATRCTATSRPRISPTPTINYVIFVAEVASTFNEQLLSRYLLDRASDDQERAFLINRQIDAMRGTIIRQTMFAEFEKIAHHSAESGEPLTLDKLPGNLPRAAELYFGPDFALDDELSLECLRIPHFYRAFYVYKYATGMSAAIALADRVLNGGKKELEAYLNFLKAGCSKDPLDLLRDAGVDMEKSHAVDTALTQFGKLVEKLDVLL